MSAGVIRQILTKAADLVDAAPMLAKGVSRVPALLLDEDGRLKFGDPSYVYNPPAPVDESEWCYCAIGAMDRAMELSGGAAHGFEESALEVLREHLGLRRIASWNDAPERTKDEVAQALRNAAETLEAVA